MSASVEVGYFARASSTARAAASTAAIFFAFEAGYFQFHLLPDAFCLPAVMGISDAAAVCAQAQRAPSCVVLFMLATLCAG
jgi:hypothetical protein